MKKYYILIVLSLLLLTGCDNKEEKIKSEYIATKNQTFNEKNYKVLTEELPVEIITTIERISEETINYQVIVKEPKENMHEVKAMVVHNYYNEDVFPSIGIFDESKELSSSTNESQELLFKDTIQTTKDINDLNLQFKVWLEYTNDNGEKKDIYYKTT